MGAAEAPRGTLFHHYKIDEQGLIRWVNLIIATGQNNLAMNRSVLQVAKHYVHGNRLTPGMLNRVEAVIRCYDPCLSCSTHAFGEMPLRIQLAQPQWGSARRSGPVMKHFLLAAKRRQNAAHGVSRGWTARERQPQRSARNAATADSTLVALRRR